MLQSLYKKTVLDSGLRIVTEYIPQVRSVSLGIWVNVGSRDERPQHSGISHFIEHMLFKGTRRRSAREIADALESVGGSINAFTAREQTCYYAKVLDEHLPVAVEVLADILKNSLLVPADLEKEKKVISEEIKDVQDSPSDLIHDLFAESIWEGHQLGRPIMGSVQSVTRLARRDLVAYLRSHYVAPAVVVAACGNVSHRKLVRLVEREFDFSANGKVNGQVRTRPRAKNRRHVQPRTTSQTHVCLGVPALPFRDEARHALLILNTILGGGMSSRLFQSVREKRGLAYTIYSFQEFYQDTGLLGIYLGTDNQQVAQAVELVLRELRKFRREKLSASELTAAKSQLKGNLMLGLESTSNRMNRLARHELFLNEYVSLDDTIRAINKVKSRDVTLLAERLLDEERLAAVVLGPNHNTLIDKIDWNLS